MERFNAACKAIAETVFREHTANKIRLQRLVYAEIRETFGLRAQMTVRAVRKVAEAYQRDASIQPTFRPSGAVVYDRRILSWKGLDRVSFLTLAGRQSIPICMDRYHEARMDHSRCQADLYRDGTFYLAVVVEVPEPPPLAPCCRLGPQDLLGRPRQWPPQAPCQTPSAVAKEGHALPSQGTVCHA